MILNSKQLEELESIHDVVAEFDEEQTTETETFSDDGAESAFAWRRGMLEKAIANVKKASRRFAEAGASLPVGALVFDKDAKRYARVTQMVANKLHVAYVSGGEADLELGKSTKTAKAEKESVKKTVVGKLPKEAIKESQAAKKPEKAAPKAETAVVVKEPAVQKLAPAKSPTKKSPVKQEKQASVKTKSATQKPVIKKAMPAARKSKAKPKAKAPLSKKTKIVAKPKKTTVEKATKKKPKRKALAFTVKGKISDPVADPNGYIRQHYKLMSNRELAEVTGLSEHTIRRKLGEWSLKRAK